MCYCNGQLLIREVFFFKVSSYRTLQMIDSVSELSSLPRALQLKPKVQRQVVLKRFLFEVHWAFIRHLLEFYYAYQCSWLWYILGFAYPRVWKKWFKWISYCTVLYLLWSNFHYNYCADQVDIAVTGSSVFESSTFRPNWCNHKREKKGRSGSENK